MLVFSEKIVLFIQDVKSIIRQILIKEVKVKASHDRFHDDKQRCSYPISVVIYTDKTMLGYFDPTFYEMGFHEQLMYADKKQLHHIIRHELAHYLTFIKYGFQVPSHGAEFRNLCQQMGWGKEVYLAKIHLEKNEHPSDIYKDSDVLRKVQKLMALATSSSQHEAESAMIKSQQLLLKHNIDSKYTHSSNEKVFLKRIMQQKQRSAKMRAIAKILEAFFVSAVFHQGKEGVVLEIVGNEVNLQIADYVADVLQNKLEDLWESAKKEHRLKGVIAKNSFFTGIAKGYCTKLNTLKQSYPGEVSSALLVIEKKLQTATAMVYPRLRSTTTRSNYCPESAILGEKAGRQLQINPSVNGQSKSSTSHLLQDFT